jgi:hypothetical protein
MGSHGISSRSFPWNRPTRRALLALVLLAVPACAPATGSAPPGGQVQAPSVRPSKADELLVVDCLLPGQIRRLGQRLVTLTPRRPIKTSARDCEIRGGEYVAWDRATYETALKVWMPLASEGDPVAQTYVGEIHEKGLGVPPDYAKAADWYRRAADAGSARAAVNLGYLYEHGLGVPRDAAQATHWYRKATGSVTTSLVVETAGAAPVSPSRAPAGDDRPRIELTEPQLTTPSPGRVPEVRVQPPIDRITIAGQVTTGKGIRTLTVNDVEQRVDADRRFRVQHALRTPDERIKVAVVDQSGQRSDVEFLVKSPVADGPARQAAVPTAASPSRYHALVIGNDDYRVLPPLTDAVAGARDIAGILNDDYEFRVTLLTNASRYDVLAALNDLRQRLTDGDSLLIFYTGRGQMDGDGRLAYWLPVDAEPAAPGSWISSQALSDVLGAMNVRQILVATDSCYAGTLGTGSLAASGPLDDQARRALVQSLAQKRSRMVMASGACESVAGGGTPRTSFARSLADILRANREALSGQELFRLVRLRLAAVEQPPAVERMQYAPIRHAGHEGGDFVFVRAIRN